MEATTDFTKVINNYCKNLASQDDAFKAKFESEKKNIDDCVTYILNTVKNSGCNGFTDEAIYGMALHYYDEDEIEVGEKINANVVVNHVGTNDKSKAYNINADEIAELTKRMNQDTNKDDKVHWLKDISNLRKNPKQYWSEFLLDTYIDEPETHEKIKFMQDFYKEKEVKVEPKKEVESTPKTKTTTSKAKPKKESIQISMF